MTIIITKSQSLTINVYDDDGFTTEAKNAKNNLRSCNGNHCLAEGLERNSYIQQIDISPVNYINESWY